MPLHAVYGNMTFSNRQNRDRAATRMTQEAADRGFTTPQPTPFPGEYAGGMELVGTTGARFCYTHSDEAVVDATLAALNAFFAANGRADGLFGSQRLTD